MPIFTIQAPDGRKVDIEANDEQTAIRGAQEWARSQGPPQKPSVGADVAKAGGTGLGQAITGFMGSFGDANSLLAGAGKLAMDVAHRINPNAGDPTGGVAPAAANKATQFLQSGAGRFVNPMGHAPTSQTLNNELGLTYQAQTLPGQVAQKVGQFAPAALLPGTIPQRVAAVALPAVGAVGARQAAKAAGAGPGGQAAAEFAGSLVGGGLSAGKLPKIPAKTPAPTLEALQAAKGAAYKAVDDMGVTYTPMAIQSLKTGVADAMDQGLIDPDLHRGATALARKVANLPDDGSVTLTKLDQVRRVVGNQIADKATTKDDRRLLYTIRDNIDDFIGSAGPEQVSTLSGDPQAAAQALQTARELHARTAKIEAVNNAVTTAKERTASTGSGGNIDNATRQELRKVLKYQRGLTEDETQQLRSAIFGDPGQNALRLAGKFSPSGNGLAAMLQTGAAIGTNGATIPLTVGGMVAKGAADAITKGKVARLVDTMARGGTKAVQAENTLAQLARRDPKALAAYKQVAQRALLAGGLASGAVVAPTAAAAQNQR